MLRGHTSYNDPNTCLQNITQTNTYTHTHYALAQSLPNRTKRQYRHHLLISFAYQCSSDFVLFGLVISAKCSNYLNESMQLCSFVSQREVLVHYKSTRKTQPNRLCSAFYLLFYLSMVLCFLVNVLLFFFEKKIELALKTFRGD